MEKERDEAKEEITRLAVVEAGDARAWVEDDLAMV